MPAGILLTLIGAMVYVVDKSSLSLLAISTLFVTLGEIIYAAVAQFAMLRLIPSGKRDGTLYSVSMVIQYMARALGGACAFPILVRGHYEMVTLCSAGVLSLGILWAMRHDLNKTTGPVQAKA
jgi:predicted MFS family arabinose efflux permease